MHKRTLIFSYSVLALMTAVSNAADVYKSFDAKGHPVYSDRPQAGAQLIVIPTESSDPSAVQARLAEEQAALAQAAAARRAKADADRMARSEKEGKARERKTSCERAQIRKRTLANERMVYTYDPQGNRVYPSETELAAQRAAAQKEAEQYCD